MREFGSHPSIEQTKEFYDLDFLEENPIKTNKGIRGRLPLDPNC